MQIEVTIFPWSGPRKQPTAMTKNKCLAADCFKKDLILQKYEPSLHENSDEHVPKHSVFCNLCLPRSQPVAIFRTGWGTGSGGSLTIPSEFSGLYMDVFVVVGQKLIWFCILFHLVVWVFKCYTFLETEDIHHQGMNWDPSGLLCYLIKPHDLITGIVYFLL